MSVASVSLLQSEVKGATSSVSQLDELTHILRPSHNFYSLVDIYTLQRLTGKVLALHPGRSLKTAWVQGKEGLGVLMMSNGCKVGRGWMSIPFR